MPEGELERVGQLVGPVRLADADARAEIGRLHEHGPAERLAPTRSVTAGSSGSSTPCRSTSERATAMPASRSTALQNALSMLAAEPSTPAPTYGQPERLEQALDRAVLAEGPVQHGEDDVDLARRSRRSRPRARRPRRRARATCRRRSRAAPAAALRRPRAAPARRRPPASRRRRRSAASRRRSARGRAPRSRSAPRPARSRARTSGRPRPRRCARARSRRSCRRRHGCVEPAHGQRDAGTASTLVPSMSWSSTMPSCVGSVTVWATMLDVARPIARLEVLHGLVDRELAARWARRRCTGCWRGRS